MNKQILVNTGQTHKHSKPVVNAAHWHSCYQHPQTETGLRCNRCDRPICAKCAKSTPVGYKCLDCIRDIQAPYFNGSRSGFVISPQVALLFTLLVAYITFLMSGLSAEDWIFAFLGMPLALGLMVEADHLGVADRRLRDSVDQVFKSLGFRDTSYPAGVCPRIGREICTPLGYRPLEKGWQDFYPIILLVIIAILSSGVDYWQCGPRGCVSDIPAHRGKSR